MTTKKKPAAKAADLEARPAGADPERSKLMADLELRPGFQAATVMVRHGTVAEDDGGDVAAIMDRLAEDVKAVWSGHMRQAEAMLYGQAHALQAIFVRLSRRSAAQELLKHWELDLRMALKAQNQCRMTLETLSTIKNPPVVFAKQANIAHGPQQVNNGAAPGGATQAAPAATPATAPTELLEEGKRDGEWLDPRAASASGRADPAMAPVGEVNRPANR